MSDLPIGWANSSLSEVLVKLVDGSHNPPQKQSSGLPMLSARNIENGEILFNDFRLIKEEDFEMENRRTDITPNDILLTIVGAIGRSAVVPTHIEKFSLQRSVAVLRPANGINSQYLKYLFDAPGFQKWMAENAKGTAQKGVYLKTLGSASIDVAPLGEQRRIVEKLDELLGRSRRAREELQHIPKLIQRYKQAVLAAAFRGDLTADWRENHSDLDTGLKLFEKIRSSREQQYKKEILELKKQKKNIPKLPEFQALDQLLEIPSSWVSISVESACLFIIDCLHSTPKFTNEGDYCIDTTCIQPGKIIWSQARKVSEEEFKLRTSRMLPSTGDILFSREGTIGTVVKVNGEYKFCLGQRMMMFRFSPSVCPKYAELYLQSPVFFDQYKPLIIGTSSPHLNIGSIRKLSFFVPSLDEQNEIVRRVEERFKAIEAIEQNYQKAIQLLDRLDQATLAKAFRGQLVPQDPNDEPASVLLERIRAQRASQPPARKRKSKATQ